MGHLIGRVPDRMGEILQPVLHDLLRMLRVEPRMELHHSKLQLPISVQIIPRQRWLQMEQIRDGPGPVLGQMVEPLHHVLRICLKMLRVDKQMVKRLQHNQRIISFVLLRDLLLRILLKLPMHGLGPVRVLTMVLQVMYVRQQCK